MSQVITKRVRVSRRAFLKGVTLAGAAIQVGLPPLVSMFNSHGTAYAAGRAPPGRRPRRPSRAGSSSGSTATAFPSATGFRAGPAPTSTCRRACRRLRSFRNDIHVLTGLDNSAASVPGPGNGHHKSISGV